MVSFDIAMFVNPIRVFSGSGDAPGLGSKGDIVTEEEREGVSGSWEKGSTWESVSRPLSLDMSSWDLDTCEGRRRAAGPVIYHP